jgi:AcrR family transcriptional regulator
MIAEPQPDVRNQILRCATRLFAERGYGSTSVRDIVEAAGVTKPALYYYFQSKEALFVAIVRFHLGELRALVSSAVEGPGPLRERLGRFVTAYVDGAMQNRDAVRLLLSLRQPHGAACEHASLDMMTLHLQHIEPLVALIQEGQSAGELRSDLVPLEAVLSLVGMVNLQVLAGMHGLEPSPQSIDRLIDLFFFGAAAR